RDLGQLLPDCRLKFRFGKRFPGDGRAFVLAELGHLSQRGTVILGDDFSQTSLIGLNVETPMHDADQRNELGTVMFDEKNVAIAYLKSRGIRYFNRVAVDGAAKHTKRAFGAGRAFDRIFDLESDISHDVAVGPLPGPFR